jgi:hypothetical protein
MMRLIVAVVSCTLSLPVLAFAQQEEHGAMSPNQIGSASVKFETSCAAALKDDVNKAVALLHSFWFPGYELERGAWAEAAALADKKTVLEDNSQYPRKVMIA